MGIESEPGWEDEPTVADREVLVARRDAAVLSGVLGRWGGVADGEIVRACQLGDDITQVTHRDLPALVYAPAS